MKISRLEPFFYVATEGGYTAAAAAMPYPLGEPAVYQQVRRLEGELGVKLVTRHGTKRVLLTPAGRMLFEYVSPFFRGLAPVERVIRLGVGGSVVIAGLRLVITDYLPARLVTLRRKFARVKAEVVESNDPDEIARQVLSGEADFGLSYFAETPVGIDRAQVGIVEAALVAPSGHPLLRIPRPGLKDLARYPIVAYKQGMITRQLFDAAFRREQLSYQAVIEAPSSDVIAAFVARGLGVSMIPVIRGARPGVAQRGLGLRRLAGIFAPHPLEIAWRGSPDEPDLLRKVRELLR